MNSRSILETPIGRLAVTAKPHGLTQLDLLAEAAEVEAVTGSVESAAHLRVAEEALNAYFSGSPDAFRDVVVAPEGTDFQRAVWSALRTIPEGTTIATTFSGTPSQAR